MTSSMTAGGEGFITTGVLAGVALLAADGDGTRAAVLGGSLGHACVAVGHSAVKGVCAVGAAARGAPTVVVGIEISTRSIPLAWREHARS